MTQLTGTNASQYQYQYTTSAGTTTLDPNQLGVFTTAISSPKINNDYSYVSSITSNLPEYDIAEVCDINKQRIKENSKYIFNRCNNYPSDTKGNKKTFAAAVMPICLEISKLVEDGIEKLRVEVNTHLITGSDIEGKAISRMEERTAELFILKNDTQKLSDLLSIGGDYQRSVESISMKALSIMTEVLSAVEQIFGSATYYRLLSISHDQLEKIK